MADYIDREALMDFPIRANHCDKKHANEHFIFGIETVLEYAQHLPVVDAVPVVRCRDCKHYDRDECYHPRHEKHLQSIFQSPDDFCSYGERRDAGT